MIITISGTAGSGKSTIAKMLAEIFKLKHYSVGDLGRKIAQERGMSIEEFNKFGETNFERDKIVDDYQFALAKKEDNFIIDGRLSWHFIPNSIKIFLDADLKTRAKRIFNDKRKSERYASLADAEKHVDDRHKSDAARYRKYYHIDNFADYKNYDLVVDTSTLIPEEIVKKIMDFIDEGKKK